MIYSHRQQISTIQSSYLFSPLADRSSCHFECRSVGSLSNHRSRFRQQWRNASRPWIFACCPVRKRHRVRKNSWRHGRKRWNRNRRRRIGHRDKDVSCKHWPNCWLPKCPTRRKTDDPLKVVERHNSPFRKWHRCNRNWPVHHRSPSWWNKEPNSFHNRVKWRQLRTTALCWANKTCGTYST